MSYKYCLRIAPGNADDPVLSDAPISGRDFLALYQSASNDALIRGFLELPNLNPQSLWACSIVRLYSTLLSFTRWTAVTYISKGGTIPDMWWYLYAHYHTRDFTGVRERPVATIN